MDFYGSQSASGPAVSSYREETPAEIRLEGSDRCESAFPGGFHFAALEAKMVDGRHRTLDTLSRVGPSQQAYFVSPRRLQRLYDALRGHDINPLPTKHSFSS